MAAPAQEGAPELAFQEAVREHEAVLRAVAMRLSGNTADAGDLVQDTFERALRAYDRLAPGANVRGWLIAILHNLFIDQCRRARRAPRTAELLPDVAAAPADPPPPPAWTRLSAEQVRAALDRLDPPFRQAYELHALEGRSYQEISSTLGIPKNTVGTRLIRARQKLKALLLGVAGEEDEP